MKAGEWMLGGGGIEQKGKRTHGHGQQCGDCWGEGGIRVLKGNEKKKINEKKEKKRHYFISFGYIPRSEIAGPHSACEYTAEHFSKLMF